MRSLTTLVKTPLAVLVLAAPLLMPAITYAGEGNQHIALTPSSTDLSIAPGDSVNGTLDVINQGNDSFTVSTSTAPYYVKGVGYDPHFTQLPGTVDASKWVALQAAPAHRLDPNALVHVDYTVHVPANTPPGGYYAVIFAETSPVQSNGGVIAHNRVGDILYITVKGPVHMKGTVSAQPFSHLNTTGSLPVSLLVGNTGGTHFKTTVTVKVHSLFFGKQVYAASDSRYVLPQTQRQITYTWNDHVPIGVYKVSRQATIPSGTVILPDTWVVIIQPWLLVVALIVVLLIGISYLRRLRARRQQRDTSKVRE